VIQRANRSIFGLGGGVVTRDVSRAIRVSSALNAGTVYVNCYSESRPLSPLPASLPISLHVRSSIASSSSLPHNFDRFSRADVFDVAAPFGGFGESGIGRELGEYGLHEYIEVKTVIIAVDPATPAQ
jgi:acyl-CoA reductase-like NAD-dependent aldehyde dehydrogenase